MPRLPHTLGQHNRGHEEYSSLVHYELGPNHVSRDLRDQEGREVSPADRASLTDQACVARPDTTFLKTREASLLEFRHFMHSSGEYFIENLLCARHCAT